jgi:uncharacterized membrane protein
MNIKRTFGTILTILGIIGLIYTAVNIIQKSSDITSLLVLGALGLIFFFTGISLVRTTADVSK